MRVDPSHFRRAMAEFATGITVVTTRDSRGIPLGLTANAFCSVSLDPPLVLVCVGERSETHAGFRDSGRFAVSVLAEDQEDLARQFALPGPGKFEGRRLVGGGGDLPLLKGALAHVLCRVWAAYPGGDHTIYLGEVEHLEVFGGRPLLFHQSLYHGLGGRGRDS
jgi:flavin reductase (DIM6/NTAB) family NADH-FMN oxidoreductase RutF